MIKQNFMKPYFFIYILTVLSLSVEAQNTVNQYDSNGERHGVWRKYYNNTKELRYEGQFDHGKEIGEFKFYTLNKGKSVLSAVKQFNSDNSKAAVKFLSSTGKLISEGQMNGRLYIGKWTYYHNKTNGILSIEYYNDNGKLDGEVVVYYPDGTVAERSNYIDGKLEGVSKWFAENGKILKEIIYKNDALNGPAKYYDADGNIKSEGIYRNDLKHGIWNYYEEGKLVKSKDHTKRSKNPKKQ